MTNLGLMVMVNQLFGDFGQEAYQNSLNKKILNLEIIDNSLAFSFEDNSKTKFFDNGQTCCEYRYMHTDDNLQDFIGAVFNSVEIREGPEENGEYGESKESEFMIVNTSKGQFTIVNYNEHNGYYGGFSLTCADIS